jgi:Phage Tail Collar Domain
MGSMTVNRYVALSTFALFCVPLTASAADIGVPGRIYVGEVRTMVIAPDNRAAIDALHHDGWIEARGTVLSSEAFPELFRAIGRTWTTDHVVAGRFAIPNIHNGPQCDLVSNDDPSSVLGAADRVQSGRVQSNLIGARSISYWIFVGRDVNRLFSTRAQR